MAIASIDSGSSLLKWFAGGEKRGLFPSRAVTVPTDRRGRRPQDEIVFDGETYFAGEAAQSAERTAVRQADLANDFHGSIRQQVQFCHAFDKMQLQNGTHQTLLTTLPLNLAYDTALVSRIRSDYRSFSWTKAGENRSVAFDEVIVTAQGAGAWLRWRQKNPTIKPEEVLVCDIGGSTVDICMVTWRDEIQDWDYHLESDSRNDWNLSTWTTELLSELEQKFKGRTFDFYKVMRAMLDGLKTKRYIIKHLGEQHDITEYVNPARDRLTRTIYEMCQKAAGDYWCDLDEVIITGGGGVFLNPSIWMDTSRPPTILDIYANVEGQYSAANDEIAAA